MATWHVRCERDSLAEALQDCARAATRVTGSAGFGAMTSLSTSGNTLNIRCADSDLEIEATISAAVEGVCEVSIPPRLASDAVAAFPPGAVTLEGEGGESAVTLSDGSTTFRLRSMTEHGGPPRRADKADVAQYEVSGSELRKALAQVTQSAARDDARPMLSSVLFSALESGGFEVVGTDSYRLARRGLDVSPAGAAATHIVPRRTLVEVQRLIGDTDSVRVGVGEHHVRYETSGYTITSALMKGAFPKYSHLTPSEYDGVAKCPKPEILLALKQVRVLAQEHAVLRLEASETGLELSLASKEYGDVVAPVKCEYEGDPDLSVKFNPQWLQEGIETSLGDYVILRLNKPRKPTVISSEGDSYSYLLMPNFN